MSNTVSGSAIWSGKPWISPMAALRSLTVLIAAILVVWLEFTFDIAFDSASGVPIISGVGLVWWTLIIFFLIWLFSMLNLLLLSATHTYVLHDDSLEIRTGIVTERSIVISPSGFSDLEVVRSVFGRMMDLGDIIIRTQSETDSEKRMAIVKDPLKVADLIRHVMARPIVRIEGQQPQTTQDKK